MSTAASRGIVFGALALGQGEVADLGGVEHAHGLPGGVGGGEEALFVAAGGFADRWHVPGLAHECEPLGATGRGVVQQVWAGLEVELEGGFGDVHAGIDRR